MQSRKQADQIGPGDCIVATLTAVFLVGKSNVQDGHVMMQVTPMACGANGCPTTCDCHYSLFAGHTEPFTLRLEAKKRLEFRGNLEECEAQVKHWADMAKRLRAGRNGSSSGNAAHSNSEDPQGVEQ